MIYSILGISARNFINHFGLRFLNYLFLVQVCLKRTVFGMTNPKEGNFKLTQSLE